LHYHKLWITTAKLNIKQAAKEPKNIRRARCFNTGMREAIVASATPKESITVKMQKIARSSLKRMQPRAPKPATYFNGKAKNTANNRVDKIVKILKVVLELITVSNYTLAKESRRTIEITLRQTDRT
jgi:hypothetical protein